MTFGRLGRRLTEKNRARYPLESVGWRLLSEGVIPAFEPRAVVRSCASVKVPSIQTQTEKNSQIEANPGPAMAFSETPLPNRRRSIVSEEERIIASAELIGETCFT